MVCDGAMGTMLYARGVFLNRCFDELNLSNPELVRGRPRRVRGGGGRGDRDQHLRRAPLQARAPRPRGAGVQDQPRGRAARARGGRRAGRSWPARIGPLGKPLEPHRQHLLRRRGGGLPRAGRGAASRAGWTCSSLETMPSLDQARAALDGGARGVRRCPSVVSLTFNEEGTTFYGDKPEDVVRDARRPGACPWSARTAARARQPMLETVQRMAAAATTAQALRPCRTPARPPWWTAATSTCARPSTWPPTPGASSPRA